MMHFRSTHIKVILSIVSAIAFTSIIILVITNVIIDPYIENTNRGKQLFEFYKNNNCEDKIYIVGDSLAQWGIDPIFIEKNFINTNKSFKVYNLADPGDNPKIRLVELSEIIKSKPKIVVICPQYRWISLDHFSENYNFYPQLEERYNQTADKIILDPYTKTLFNKTELTIFQDPFRTITHKRTFLIPGLQFMLSQRLPFIKPPTNLRKYSFKVDFLPPTDHLSPSKLPYAKIYAENNSQKKAFWHMATSLKDHGILVIIITMPYQTGDLRYFGNESLNNYYNFIKTLNCNHYDLAQSLPEGDFWNYNHLNYNGRQNFTKQLAKILLLEVRNVS